MTPSRNVQSGFTLIEILIVVFILGLLATIVGVNVMGRTDEARVTKAMADLKEIEQALHLYRLDNGRYPDTSQGLQALIEKPSTGRIPRKWNPGGYLSQTNLPVDPWGSHYVYLSDGSNYVLKSLGADGEQGGEGFDADLDSRDLS